MWGNIFSNMSFNENFEFISNVKLKKSFKFNI